MTALMVGEGRGILLLFYCFVFISVYVFLQVFEPDTISFDSADSETSKLFSKETNDQSSSSVTQDMSTPNNINSKDNKSLSGRHSTDKVPKCDRTTKESTSTITPCEHYSQDSSSSNEVGGSPATKNGTMSNEELAKLVKTESKERKDDADDAESNHWGRKTESKESSIDEMFSPVSMKFRICVFFHLFINTNTLLYTIHLLTIIIFKGDIFSTFFLFLTTN